jgi:hypothetical protein
LVRSIPFLSEQVETIMGGRSEMRVPSGGGSNYSGGGGGSSSGGGGSGCFASGTLVKTIAGPKDIATLNKGDLVITFDPHCNMEVVRPILKVAHKRNIICEITFADGKTLRTTATHSLSVGRVWKKVSQLKAGDCLTCLSATGLIESNAIASISRSSGMEDVHNLVVEGNFTFIAGDVLAHSFTHCRAARIVA